jgi:CHAT domain-containing protein
MIQKLQYTILSSFCIIGNLAASSWEDILKSDAPVEQKAEPKKRSWTDGLQIDTFTKIESTSQNHWQDLLQNDDRKAKSTINDTKEVRELIDQMAKVDGEMADSSAEKPLVISGFGLLFAKLGDFTKAQQCCLRGFKLAEQNCGDNAKTTLLCMKNLADLFMTMGDDDRAMMILKDGLETAKAHPDSAGALTPAFQARLSEVQLQRAFYKQADENSTAALEEGRKDGASPEAKALALEARALYLRSLGDRSASEVLLREELAVLSPADNTSGGSGGNRALDALKTEALLNLYELLIAENKIPDAEAILPDLAKALQKSNGIFTPEKARFLKHYAVFNNQKGNREGAKKSADEHLRYVTQTLDSALSMVEAQRLGWQRTYLDYSLPVALCTSEELADRVIRWKGIVLDSLIGDRVNLGRNSTEAAITTNKELASCRQKLLQLQMSGSSDQDEVQKVKNRIFYLERKMSEETRHYYNAKVSEADLKGLKAALAPSDALVEYISYRDFPDIRFGEERLGALVITKEKPVTWIPLGTAAGIKAKLDTIQTQIAGSGNDADLRLRLQDLHGSLWKGIADALPGSVTHVYISPEGLLNFAPFPCLVDEQGKFAAERYSMSYVGSGRDLLVKSTDQKSNELRIFANPKFELGTAPQVASRIAQRSAAQDELDKVSLPPLPGTEREAKELSKLAASCNWKPQLLLSTEANKVALTNLRPPGILHLATHGFFLGGVSTAEAGTAMRGMVVKAATDGGAPKTEVKDMPAMNPMIQSGIALTGAQTTLNLWKDGKAPDPANDGVLTAQDVAGLDLKGTWLVTLSACETGKGEAKSGEGVFGLRRAFMMAGAQNLVMTLWPVSDDVTPLIMADFYKAAMTSHNAPDSLSKVQRDWLVKLRDQKGILQAVRDAGPFSMVVMANPNLKTSEVIQSDMEIKEKKDNEQRERQKNMPKNQDIDHLDELFKKTNI